MPPIMVKTPASPGNLPIEVFDFTEHLKKIELPTLVVHGDDDQIVPIAAGTR